ncbi:uncharacterized protein [Panulirus ornatus]|uniref:uncharacterized protein n=1 Tax=Panulirus ornatus TaxID=150431 RepID=UPI003A847524
MSHVTVVQVHQSHLKTYNEEVLSRRVVETPRDGLDHTQTWNTCHKKESVCLVFHDDQQKCSGSNKVQNSDVLHIHLKDLQEQSLDGTAVDTSPAAHPEDCELPGIHASRRLVRKSSIIDQNVGVTGTVYMVSEPISHHSLDSSDDESESSLTSSVSSLSESDSGLSSTIEVGMSPVPHHSTTIAIGEEHEALENKVLLHITPAAKEEDAADPREESTREGPREVLSPHTSESQDINDSTDTSVVLKWRVIPPSPPVLQQPALLELDGDRGSTPTSFSSAYTVTEHENESTSEDSEASRHNWSGQESDEELQGIPGSTDHHHDPEDPTQHNGHEDDSLPWAGESKHSPAAVPTDSATARYIVENQIIPNITGNAKMPVLSGAVNSRRGADHRGMLCRVRHASGSSSSSGDESIVYSYIPCRDQREKEDEELWVANEAADPGGTQTFQGTTPPLFPPPWGWGGSLDRGSGKPGLAKREVVWAEQRWVSHGCLSSPSCVASVMCTVAPSLAAQVGTTSRRHYSTRQREAESQIIEIVDEEPKYKENWNKLNNNEAQTRSETLNLHRSATTNMPTKRFSFLIRSNSIKRESTSLPDTQTVVAPVRQPVNPSDQAILDKLATLNIEAPEVTTLKPKTRCSLFDPPCTRCGEPVYHQERTEPTLRLVYHSSCFKCHHCGVRLTLKTFFRSPLDSKDTRVFCKSHVPALDPGRLDVNRSDTSSSGKSSPDSAAAETRSDTSRGSNSSNKEMATPSLQDRLDVVKCDTIGLRYF